MNKGTRIRTVLRVMASLQTAVSVTTMAVTNLGEELGCRPLIIAWVVFAIVCDFVVSAVTTYYNQDYTLEGEIGTIETRELKAKRGEPMPYVEEPEDSEVK